MGNTSNAQTPTRMVYACSGVANTGFLADEAVVIDGCPKACGKRIFAEHRIPMAHLMTTEFDVVKGEIMITDDLVADVGARMLAAL